MAFFRKKQETPKDIDVIDLDVLDDDITSHDEDLKKAYLNSDTTDSREADTYKKKGSLFARLTGKKDEAADKKSKVLIKSSSFFKAVKPFEGYVFYSDYYDVDDSVGVVLTVLHDDGSEDSLPVFWGINLIPQGLPEDISTHILSSVERVPDSWVEQHQSKAEDISSQNVREMGNDGTMGDQMAAQSKITHMREIAADLQHGGKYLRVAFRVLLKASNIERLELAVDRLNRHYQNQFDTLYVAPYDGEQQAELANMLRVPEQKEGKNYMFTSQEYAGFYNLVTHGIEDPNGEYLGTMLGDVNNSALLFDFDNYRHHVVLAGNNDARTVSGADFGREYGVDVLGTKLGMAAMMNNRRVVHLVLNNSKVNEIGVNLDDITSVVNMENGDINPFELFGDFEEELPLFSAHVEKIRLMFEQFLDANVVSMDLNIIRTSLNSLINEFYITQNMWVENAKANRDKLRVVGLAHEEYPQMSDFVVFLNQKLEAARRSKSNDQKRIQAYNVIYGVFKQMLDINGDLFNVETNDIIDGVHASNRVIFNFSSLTQRSGEIAMAQFVNALSFAVGSLKNGDVVILHGTDQLSSDILDYVKYQFERLFEKRVRVVYIYRSLDNMLRPKDREVNAFDRADYNFIGNMSDAQIQAYEESTSRFMPESLKKHLVTGDPTTYYLRRGFDNIVFNLNISMGADRKERGL